MDQSPPRLIARLAAAVMAADGHVRSPEIASLVGLQRLGLGALGELAREELLRAMHEPVDVRGACTALARFGPPAGPLILTALTDIAVSDGELTASEGELLAAIGALLAVPASVVEKVLQAAAVAVGSAAPPEASSARCASGASPLVGPREAAAPAAASGGPLAEAYAALGLQPGASRLAIESAYREVLERYEPSKVVALGLEFAVLAVRRLAAATAALEALVAVDSA